MFRLVQPILFLSLLSTPAPALFCRQALQSIAAKMLEYPQVAYSKGNCLKNIANLLRDLELEGQALDKVQVVLVTHEELKFSGIGQYQKSNPVVERVAPIGYRDLNHHAFVLYDGYVLDLDLHSEPQPFPDYFATVFPPFSEKQQKEYAASDRLFSLKGRAFPAKRFLQHFEAHASAQDMAAAFGRDVKRDDHPIVSLKEMLPATFGQSPVAFP